ncbi:MAG: hypothetical protein Ta2B_17400 [Termitinemataceae bacterium]|nr:MAG: hypothetical protein Ta2B_17400 [Termitinemataceae bacterium]
MKIDIFNETKYNHYKHINHYLYDYLCDKHEVRFLQRFYMHKLSLSKIFEMLFSIFSCRGFVDKNISNDKGIRILNIPHISRLLDKMNFFFVKLQLKYFGDICITFVPSPSLSDIYKHYKTVIYYCVHDSLVQKYSDYIIDYEKYLIDKSNILFCDNETVLSRFIKDSSEQYISILDSSESKFYHVPPPVPDIFFDIQQSVSEPVYDFIYFGSIHDNIEIEAFYELANLNNTILIMSNEAHLICKNRNIIIKNATADLRILCENISLARYILFPYKNTKFIETISPGKLNQSFATKKPIISSSVFLTKKYNLIDYNIFIKNEQIVKTWTVHEDINKYKNSILMEIIESKIEKTAKFKKL